MTYTIDQYQTFALVALCVSNALSVFMVMYVRHRHYKMMEVMLSIATGAEALGHSHNGLTLIVLDHLGIDHEQANALAGKLMAEHAARTSD